MKRFSLSAFIILFLSFSFSSNPPGWYVQTLPVNKNITDIFFIDSLNGWSVTEWAPQFDTGYILNTTNGGDKWNVQFRGHLSFNVLNFPTDSIGYAGGGDGFPKLYKTSNGGLNWMLVNPPPVHQIIDAYFINKDTGWTCDDDILFGGLYKTSNGSLSWVQQLDASYKIQKIFFLNKDTGWAAGRYDGISSKLFRTTNGGNNWNLQYTFTQQLNDIYFFNEFVGIISSGFSYKTTDGGFNWVLTNDGGIELSFGSDSVGWAGNNFTTIIKTTTAGSSWYRQTTNINNPSVSAFDSLTAWAAGSQIVHTTNGGLTAVEFNTEIPNNFILYQNFPNPFNPVTNLEFGISELPARNNNNSSENYSSGGGFVSLKVYDILGKEVATIVNENLRPGTYKYRFDASELSSGVYFYTLATQNFKETKRMLLLK